MGQFITASRAETLNAKVGAISLAAAAFMTLLLSHVVAPLSPLRLLLIVLAAFATWCLCDEMGMRKPLNRAGFAFFAIAAAVKVQIILGVSAEFAGRYYLLYTAFLLASVFFWSLAFLHRQQTPKMVGEIGMLASSVPIIALIVGHIAVGTGAVLGIGAMLSAAEGSVPADIGFVTLIERIFGLWCYLAAWLLWRGHITAAKTGA